MARAFAGHSARWFDLDPQGVDPHGGHIPSIHRRGIGRAGLLVLLARVPGFEPYDFWESNRPTSSWLRALVFDPWDEPPSFWRI